MHHPDFAGDKSSKTKNDERSVKTKDNEIMKGKSIVKVKDKLGVFYLSRKFCEIIYFFGGEKHHPHDTSKFCLVSCFHADYKG
jgi:hypothetical protein